MQNGHRGSFHSWLRDECLIANWFRSFDHVRSTLKTRRIEYNEERPHSSLDCYTPREFCQTLEGSRAMALLPFPSTTIDLTERLQL